MTVNQEFMLLAILDDKLFTKEVKNCNDLVLSLTMQAVYKDEVCIQVLREYKINLYKNFSDQYLHLASRVAGGIEMSVEISKNGKSNELKRPNSRH